jgi:F420-dependent oxidoreductase-like protein
MRLGLMAGYSGAQFSLDINRVKEAESLGYDSVWTAEAWGSDAVSPLAWIAGQTSKIRLGTSIMQLPGRSPSLTAMTAMTLDALSGGRMILGLGTSGPQVVEGWHGHRFYKPLTWMKEYVTICRKIFAREEVLTYQGEHYRIPYDGPDASGLGKPLKSILHGRKDIPIYTGSMAPKGQEQSGEIADGCLLTCMDPEKPEVITDNLKRGFAKANQQAAGSPTATQSPSAGGGKSIETFDLAPTVAVVIGPDVQACMQPLKQQLALYIGGMGAREKNFYNEYIRRIGFEAEAIHIQDLYLAGKREEAIAAVPDDLVDRLYLVGPKERIRERFQRWKHAPIGTFIVGSPQMEAIRLMAELANE